MKNIRLHIIIFMTLLLLSGVTAFPIQSEIITLYFHHGGLPLFMHQWIVQLFETITRTPQLMFYGTDWLAFAHIVISLFFVPVFINPTGYKANLIVGMMSCLLIFPLAFICGPIRGIPFFHQLIDCSFGLFGFLYLYYILIKINKLKTNQ